LLAPDLITAASKAPPSVTVDKAHGRAIGSAIGGRIHAADCIRISAIPLPTALNSSSGVMANSLLPIWCSATSPQPVMLIGFRIPVPINMSHLILPPWLLQNRILVMIICMLVIVRAFLYLISVIQKYIHHIVLSPYLMFFMFLQSRNLYSLFRNFVLTIMFVLNFTLECFMSRISTLMKSFSQVRVKMVSMPWPSLPSRQFLKPIGLPTLLPLSTYGIVD
jgi:hypothetical protein